MEFHFESMRESYGALAKIVLARGEEVSPRGDRTREIRGATVHLHDPGDALPVGTGRGVVPAIGALELLQVAAGITDLDSLVRVASHFARFADGGVLRGAYGPRLFGQLEDVVWKLRADPSTRQAVVTIWDPALDNEPGLHDYPCTVTLGWMIRGGRLEAFTSMRSNDVWLGVPYDFFLFTQLQMTLANILGVEAGTYHHHAWSLHLYERHWSAAGSLEEGRAAPPPVMGLEGPTWERVSGRALDLFACATGLAERGAAPELDYGERWLVETVQRRIAARAAV